MTALIIFFVLAAIVLLLSFLTYCITFRSPDGRRSDMYDVPPGEQYKPLLPEMKGKVAALAGRPFQQVFITSHDGLRLTGRYYHVKDGAPLSICFHGYRGNCIRDFCGVAPVCFSMGHNVLLVDQRGQGISGGHTMTFGVREKRDCVNWVKYAVERFGAGVEIFLWGVSMGGTTVLLAAGEQDLPANVLGVVADCPYSSAKGIIMVVCRRLKLPAAALYPLIALGARLFGRFPLSEGEVLPAVDRAHTPILILHGEADRLVPCDMSRELCAACPGRVELHTFPGAAHGVSVIADPARYEAAVRAFAAAQTAKEGGAPTSAAFVPQESKEEI